MVKAPVNLPTPPTAVSQDEFDKLSARHIEITNKYYELLDKYHDMKENRETSRVLNSLIRPFAYGTFGFMVLYCIAVAVLVFEQASGSLKTPMSDGVVELLVGSTAATVIGLVGMVLTGVFVGAHKAK